MNHSDLSQYSRYVHPSLDQKRLGVPTCPICRSPYVHRISGGSKLGSFALVGPFALRKAMRSYRCYTCRAMF